MEIYFFDYNLLEMFFLYMFWLTHVFIGAVEEGCVKKKDIVHTIKRISIYYYCLVRYMHCILCSTKPKMKH